MAHGMETTNESDTSPPAAVPENCPASAGDALDVTDRKPAPFGRPFAPGVSGNPGGRPKDTIAALVRDATCDGADVVAFLVAVVRDDVDGRMADKGGMIDRLFADATALEKRADKLEKDAGAAVCVVADDVRKMRDEAFTFRARADALRLRLARKRKIAVAVKTRVAAAQVLLERGWGKPLETVDLTLGNPDGSPLGGDGRPPPPRGPLANLTNGDLAEIGAVLERATKRDQVVEVSP